MDLLEAWARWQPKQPPFVLAEDIEVLESAQSSRAVVSHASWRQARNAPDFCAPGDRRLHLGLLPQPFCGDLRRATIYLLLLNPGLGPHDYYGEYEVREYRRALLENLKQRFRGARYPFLFLDPRFAWHGGFHWWHDKLAGVIQRIKQSRDISFAEARSFLASRIASIELLPYHSPAFRDAGGWLRRLKSVELARDFVREFIKPRVLRRQAIVIVTRQATAWELLRHPGVVVYTGAQARAAHLTPQSPGGAAMLKHLGIPE